MFSATVQGQTGDLNRPNGVPIYLEATGHGITLNYDNVLEYCSDPARGERYGFLSLKVQLHMGGNQIWVEPMVHTRG
jgi:hypothetical protein